MGITLSTRGTVAAAQQRHFIFYAYGSIVQIPIYYYDKLCTLNVMPVVAVTLPEKYKKNLCARRPMNKLWQVNVNRTAALFLSRYLFFYVCVFVCCLERRTFGERRVKRG